MSGARTRRYTNMRGRSSRDGSIHDIDFCWRPERRERSATRWLDNSHNTPPVNANATSRIKRPKKAVGSHYPNAHCSGLIFISLSSHLISKHHVWKRKEWKGPNQGKDSLIPCRSSVSSGTRSPISSQGQLCTEGRRWSTRLHGCSTGVPDCRNLGTRW